MDIFTGDLRIKEIGNMHMNTRKKRYTGKNVHGKESVLLYRDKTALITFNMP